MLVLCLLTQAKSCTHTQKHAHCVSLLRVCMCAKKKKETALCAVSALCIGLLLWLYALFHTHAQPLITHTHSHPHTETHTIKMIALANAVRQHGTRCCCLPACSWWMSLKLWSRCDNSNTKTQHTHTHSYTRTWYALKNASNNMSHGSSRSHEFLLKLNCW